MKNQEIANIFYEIADFLKMKEVSFKPQAYERVAVVLEALDEDVADIYKKEGRQGLEDIPGVGESIADKIEEYLKTGEIKYYQRLKKETPVRMEELNQVEGLGPKKIKVLYEKLGIKNLRELEKAKKRLTKFWVWTGWRPK